MCICMLKSFYEKINLLLFVQYESEYVICCVLYYVYCIMCIVYITVACGKSICLLHWCIHDTIDRSNKTNCSEKSQNTHCGSLWLGCKIMMIIIIAALHKATRKDVPQQNTLEKAKHTKRIQMTY